ncbi:MAG: MBL fold metallo-hydrolase [Candidatus Nanopelagicales bacterium]|nr:MBL fold metallo-hydrolase [Candidatus Nanopelagicales bacterium]
MTLKQIGSSEPWSGGTVTPGASCVLAPNPSAMTLDGTNTWILGLPGAEEVVLVDPGPSDPRHLERVRSTLASQGSRVKLILLTHGHSDHAQAASEFARVFGAPVIESGGGEVAEVPGLDIQAIATPGHSSDSVSFFVRSQSALVTGDTVLGRGTTVVAHPDGSLADYLRSLQALRDLAAAEAVEQILPGHGPVLRDPVSVLSDYLEHRHARLEQVRRAVHAGARSAADIVSAVYQPIPPQVVPAATASARAQLEYLAELGEI